MKGLISIIGLMCVLVILTAQTKTGQNQGKLHLSAAYIDTQLKDAVEQYKYMATRLNEPGRLPKTYYANKDSLETSSPEWWTSGFYPGTLLYLYEYAGDPVLKAEADKMLRILEKEKDDKTTHDLGFMLYCSFGNANRLQPSAHYKQVLLTGAESLISRFNSKVGCIKSWDLVNSKWQFPVIIDNMMNLEFLNWASRESGDQKYINISKTHANTTLKHHFRDDYSSYHVVDYDSISGEVRNRHTAQGARHESAWARGQTWGLYGYTMMYRDTKDVIYLNQAIHIAEFILNHPNLPKDGIPYWDFNADNITQAKRDASAAAIIASVFARVTVLCQQRTAGKVSASCGKNVEKSGVKKLQSEKRYQWRFYIRAFRRPYSC
ncbi:glycosyl hydrolase, family 88 [Sphingobacterium spiritivorum ATCC 33300]|uniref:Glycosyl hydrolase, family 88 n=1 Tax=Sphingobacterium spiritivorum ATCC 33300 TaxID=525372 RepID=C2FTH9_SPHSI|nr:glycoside hydrolase family 88 protein [Sphingobacterium spiritivorum]EEI93782.1 glycosyl hydrolase, family 88 [Sphingobacterium spiritivorum ATCC 33300]